MKSNFFVFLGLFLLSVQQTFLEEKIDEGQGPIIPNDYNEIDYIEEKTTYEEYLGLKENKCTNPYQSGPHWVGTGCNKLGQCNGHNCGPHSIHQVLTKFGIEDFHENQIAVFAGTTESGTGHPGLNKAIQVINSKKGTKITLEWKNFSSFGTSVKERFEKIAKIICNPNQDVIIHNYYRNKWGHYETIKGIDVEKQTVSVLNSLGTKSGTAYLGYIESRTFSTYAGYISGISQPSIGVLTKK